MAGMWPIACRRRESAIGGCDRPVLGSRATIRMASQPVPREACSGPSVLVVPLHSVGGSRSGMRRFGRAAASSPRAEHRTQGAQRYSISSVGRRSVGRSTWPLVSCKVFGSGPKRCLPARSAWRHVHHTPTHSARLFPPPDELPSETGPRWDGSSNSLSLLRAAPAGSGRGWRFGAAVSHHSTV